jgi:tetraacyldisaccharide 4'-kinase
MPGGDSEKGTPAVKEDGPVIIDKRGFRPVGEMEFWKRAALAPAAYPASLVYALGIRLWRRRTVRPAEIGLPVISVGSIQVGGTGKTPLTMLIARHLMECGMRVAVVSRGYKRKHGEAPLIAGDWEGPRADVEEAGDEPFLLALRLPGVAVVVDPDRVRGAIAARDELKPDVVLLDDGFQCRGLMKNLDIVTVSPAALMPGAGYIPWGPLRESPSAIGTDDWVVYIAGGPADTEMARSRLPSVSYVCPARYSGPMLIEPRSGEEASIPEKERALLVSGIARPEGFERTSSDLGITPPAVIRFDDHHWYGRADVSMIQRVMRETGSRYVVTTEKDFWRLPEEIRQVSFAVRVSLLPEDGGFLQKVAECAAE